MKSPKSKPDSREVNRRARKRQPGYEQVRNYPQADRMVIDFEEMTEHMLLRTYLMEQYCLAINLTVDQTRLTLDRKPGESTKAFGEIIEWIRERKGCKITRFRKRTKKTAK